MGALGLRVERPSELALAFERALHAERPVLLDVRTDIKAMAPRAWLGQADAPLRPGTGY